MRSGVKSLKSVYVLSPVSGLFLPSRLNEIGYFVNVMLPLQQHLQTCPCDTLTNESKHKQPRVVDGVF